MKIALVHNFYKISGGEDTVFYNEADLLKSNGHDVIFFTKYNNEIAGFFSKFVAFFSCIFSIKVYREFNLFLKENRPDIVHVHNYFPLLSPVVFFCCAKNNMPVVHTLHNFRAICPSASLSFNGRVNIRSVKGSPFWTVLKRVYRSSYIGTFAVYLMVVFHRKLGTWNKCVDKYICLTEFAKDIYVQAGWPPEKIVIKPNFTNIQSLRNNSNTWSGEKFGAIFIGRLSEEKGLSLLIDSWRDIDYPLTIVGDGPLGQEIITKSHSAIKFLGQKNTEEVFELLQKSAFIIMPSTCYETFGMVLIEAAALATPAIVSRIGALQEVVVDGQTGLHFTPGDVNDLKEKISIMILDDLFRYQCGSKARAVYEEKFSQTVNYTMLINIYIDAIKAGRHDRA